MLTSTFKQRGVEVFARVWGITLSHRSVWSRQHSDCSLIAGAVGAL